MLTVSVNKVVNAFMNNPVLGTPIVLNWKRESVIRRVNVSKTNLSGDVYYYSPTGKKLRPKKISTDMVRRQFKESINKN